MDDCCKEGKEKESKGFLSGLLYGLIPHTGCIAFILFTIAGVTTATTFFKPLLMNAYFFYILILVSFLFATLSAGIYLKRKDLLSLDGIKKKWKYLSILYGTSISVNLILFLLIFPMAANMTSATGNVVSDGLNKITLKVDIPCPGHAPLITGELKTINGVENVKFSFPDYFEVSFSGATSQKEMLSLEVFDSYPATVTSSNVVEESNQPVGCSSCGSCDGTCGGSCGI
jgi:hypothetical protein